ncbi:MAG: EAL domain-containing protein [Rubrivivax sp.]|nr:EAL domain-containing protein [Rubrivivax sp.]
MNRPAPSDTADAEQLRTRAEAQLTRMRATLPPSWDMATVLHELQVHRIELEMQNEELRRAQVALEGARDRYRDLYEFAPVGYFALDTDETVLDANRTAALLLGQPHAALVGTRFVRHLAVADRDDWHRLARRLWREGGAGRIELSMKGAGDLPLAAQLDVLCVRSREDLPTLRVAVTDITLRRRAEAETRIAAAAFETQEGIVITDAEGVIRRVNQAYCDIVGYTADELIGHTAGIFRSERHDAAFFGRLWTQLLHDGHWQGEMWNRRKSGELYPAWLTINAVRDEHGPVLHYVGMLMDISQRKAREDEIARLAFHDALTGLPNRQLLKDRLQQALSVAARNGREGALLFIDLDHFKRINDTLGHDCGDLLLQQVARRLVSCVREGDTVARLGGDEFIVMLADLSDTPPEAAAQARAAAEKVLHVLTDPHVLDGHDYRGGASVGIALFGAEPQTADELLKRADQAMYQAKAAGRHRLCFFDADVQQRLLDRFALEAELRHALLHQEFVLHYQPLVDEAGGLLGAEALVRWQHPRRGLLAPAQFIDVAEESGLIEGLGQWVLQTACRQLVAWAAHESTRALTLAVNVSARQFREAGFASQLLELLRTSGANPARLTLELTENTMLDSIEGSVAAMNTLTARGVRFALDDFGTGYSSIAYLKRLPLGQLKIDRSFVQDVLDNTNDAAITRTILALGQNLGMDVIAEGVETEAQRAFLAAAGCRQFQGYLFGRPLPLAGWQAPAGARWPDVQDAP